MSPTTVAVSRLDHSGKPVPARRRARVVGIMLMLAYAASATARVSLLHGTDSATSCNLASFGFSSAGPAQHNFAPFAPAFAGGVRVALGDVNGDGTPDLVAGAGPGAAPTVRVYDGALATTAPLFAFDAFNPLFTGGVYVAAGDVNGDGFADIVVGAGAGGGTVSVFSGANALLLASFSPFGGSYTAGVRVACADLTGGTGAEIIAAAGPGGLPFVKVFDYPALAVTANFLAYPTAFTGGVFVAAGDTDGGAKAEIVTGADGGGTPEVRVFDGGTATQLHSWLAFAPGFTGGVRVAAGDLTGDGKAEIVAAPGPGATATAARFTPSGTSLSNVVYTAAGTSGMFVAAFGDPSAPVAVSAFAAD